MTNNLPNPNPICAQPDLNPNLMKNPLVGFGLGMAGCNLGQAQLEPPSFCWLSLRRTSTRSNLPELHPYVISLTSSIITLKPSYIVSKSQSYDN